MPVIRKLTAEEVRVVESESKSGTSGVRAATRAQYDSILSQYAVGDAVELTLDEGEKVITVKHNVIAAAKRLNVGVEFLRAQRGKGKSMVRFRIVEVDSGDTESSVADEAESE